MTTKVKKQKLTPKQQRFVDEYLIDLNATQAAIRAGYSAKTADRIGPELLGKTCVAEAIAKAKNKRAERTGVTAEKVVDKIQEMLNVCAAQIVYKVDGEPVLDSNGVPVKKLVDAPTAAKLADMLMKHVGAYEADNKQELSGGITFVWGDKS